jgi:hypothetical protein
MGTSVAVTGRGCINFQTVIVADIKIKTINSASEIADRLRIGQLPFVASVTRGIVRAWRARYSANAIVIATTGTTTSQILVTNGRDGVGMLGQFEMSSSWIV